jgi:hypothetical protein
MSGRSIKLAVAAATALVLALPAQGFAGNNDGKGGSGAQGGAVAATEFSSQVKNLSYAAKGKKWTGKVTSDFEVPSDALDVPNQVDDNVCIKDRTVKLFKKGKKSDTEVGKDKTNGNGEFEIKAKKRANKKYFVQVTEHKFAYRDYYSLSINAVCLGVKKDF